MIPQGAFYSVFLHLCVCVCVCVCLSVCLSVCLHVSCMHMEQERLTVVISRKLGLTPLIWETEPSEIHTSLFKFYYKQCQDKSCVCLDVSDHFWTMSTSLMMFLNFSANQTKAALQQYLSKDSTLSEWVYQQQSMTSGDSRQLAAMVMGLTSSSSSSLLESLSDTMSSTQKLPSDPSLLRGYENERAKGNSLLRKV